MTLALAIGLLALGVLLIVAEVLFPSFGALSVAAAACIIGSVVAAFAVNNDTGVNFLIAVAVLVPTAVVLGLKVFPHTPFGKYMVARGLSFESRAATDDRDLVLVGHEGEVESVLRPAGMARIDGRRVDVVSRGEMIEPGSRVRVIEVEGNRVVVARAPEPDPRNDNEETESTP